MVTSLPRSGDVLPRGYVVRQHLGSGGMGVVFLAEQPSLGREVAIKIMRAELAANPALVARFLNEAATAGRVSHPNVVSVFDRDELMDGTPFLVMERVRGVPLGRIVAEQALPVARALAILDQVLRAVAAIHDAGVIHGDLKADNVLVDEEDRDHVTLIDFGLARLAAVPATGRTVSGTPEYMAPELASGSATTIATDLYAVAVIAYEMLAGTTPFTGKTAAEILERHADDVVVQPSLRRPAAEISRALDEVVCRGLAKRPDQRFETTSALASALAAAGRAYRSRGIAAPPERARRASSTTVVGSPRRRLAHGSDRLDVISDRALRAEIAYALAAGDVARIARGYEALVDVLVAEHMLPAALRELREGIDVLSSASDPASPAGAYARRLATREHELASRAAASRADHWATVA